MSSNRVEFNIEFHIAPETLKKLAPAYGFLPDKVDPNTPLKLTITAHFNIEEQTFAVTRIGGSASSEFKNQQENSLFILQEIIRAEKRTSSSFHVKKYFREKYPYYTSAANVDLIYQLRQKGLISVDNDTLKACPSKDFFDCIDYYKAQLSIGRERYIAEKNNPQTIEDKKTEAPSDQKTTDKKEQALQNARKLLKIKIDKYMFRAEQRSYPQHIFRRYSAQLMLNYIANNKISFEGLVQHLEGHKVATKLNHANIHRTNWSNLFGFVHLAHTPELAVVYQDILDLLKKACPEEFKAAQQRPKVHIELTLPALIADPLFKKIPVDIEAREQRLKEEILLANNASKLGSGPRL